MPTRAAPITTAFLLPRPWPPMRLFAVGGRLSAGVSRKIRRIGGRTGNTYRYASVYFVPLGFAKGWLKGSGGRPAARLFFFFGNYPAGTFRAALPLRERAISENSTPGRTGVPAEEVRTCLAGAFALRAISSPRQQPGQSPSTCRLAAMVFGMSQACPIRPWYRARVGGGLRKRAGLVNGGTQPGLFPVMAGCVNSPCP